MTLLHTDGIESRLTTVPGKWDTVGSNTISTYGPGGSLALRINSDNQYLEKIVGSGDRTLIASCRVQIDVWTRGNGNSGFLDLLDAGGTTHLSLVPVAGGGLEVRRGSGGTVIAEDTTALLGLSDTWHYVEFKAYRSDTVGTVEVWIDGTRVINATGLDTNNGGTATDGFGRVRFARRQFMGYVYYRDIVILDDNGSVNNDVLGDVTVEALRPNGAGNYSQWTPLGGGANYLEVDETGVNDGDTSYNSESTVGQRDSYSFDDITPAAATIFGVNVQPVVRHEGVAVNVEPFVRRAAADYDLGAAEAVASSYAIRGDGIWEVDPSTSSAWTVANLNAAEFGVRLQ